MARRKIFVHHYPVSVPITWQILAPETVRSYHIKSVAHGGDGGSATVSQCGSGGGAGDYMDVVVELMPNSLITVAFDAAAGVNVQYSEYEGYPEPRQFQLVRGSNGTTPALGGNSGAGNLGGGGIGGLLPDSSPLAYGQIDSASGLAFGTGGQTVWTGANILGRRPLALESAYYNGAAGPFIKIARQKWPPNFVNYALSNQPGLGGCSYFGGANQTGEPGYGAGGCGGTYPSGLGQSGGPAMFTLEWDVA